VNKTVKPMLAKYVEVSHRNWDDYIQIAISSYNNVTHASTGISPFEALFGRKPVLIADVVNNNKLPAGTLIKNVSDFVLNLKIRAYEMNRIIQSKLDESHEKQKVFYDKSIKNHINFKIGDTVKLINYAVKEGHSKAFTEKFIGPFKIVDKLNDLIYVIETNNGRKETIHYNRMLIWHERVIKPSLEIEEVNLTNNKQEMKNNDIKTLIEGETLAHFLSVVKRRRKKANVQNFNLELANLLNINENNEDLESGQDEVNNLNENIEPVDERDTDETIDDVVERNLIEFTHGYFTRQNPRFLGENRVNESIVVAPESLDTAVRYNDKVKITIRCINCGNWYEQKHGLKVHQRKCNANQNLLDSNDESGEDSVVSVEIETRTPSGTDLDSSNFNENRSRVEEMDSPVVNQPLAQLVTDADNEPTSGCTQS
jgi:hypothetical protein